MSASQWFDAFRDTNRPLLYSHPNRTSAVYDDILNIFIYLCFSTLFVAFVVILPGVRKQRFSTSVCVSVSLFVGASILISNFGSSWHVAQSSISSPYRAFSRERLYSNIGVRIGLRHVNVTLKAHSFHKNHDDINYNERFSFAETSDMKKEHRNALQKGLPYPILTITEYLSQDAEGFCWGRRYRLAGHYASFFLWVSFALWVLSNVLLCAVPRYGAYCLQMVGLQLLTVNFIYWALLPAKPLFVPFESGFLRFQLGWCYWLVAVAGLLSLFLGSSLLLLDTLFPHRFSTILQVDYDTPYRYLMTHANESPFDKLHCLADKNNNSSSSLVALNNSNNNNNKNIDSSNKEGNCDCSRRKSTVNNLKTSIAHDNAAFETDDLPINDSTTIATIHGSQSGSVNSSSTTSTTTKSDSSNPLRSLPIESNSIDTSNINRSDQAELSPTIATGNENVYISPSGKRAVSLQQFNQLVNAQMLYNPPASRNNRSGQTFVDLSGSANIW